MTLAVSHIHKLHKLEHLIATLPPVETVTEHLFGTGVYVREMVIPAGTVITGKLHKTRHIFALVKGECSISTPDGPRLIAAPFVCVSDPGTKRAVLTKTECIFLNIHQTDERDVDKLESQLIEHEPNVDECRKLQRDAYPALECA